MKYSIVTKQNLNNEFRLDAEFFAPEIIHAENCIAKHKNDEIDRIANVIHPTEIERIYSDAGIQILLAQNVRNNYLCFDIKSYMQEEKKRLLSSNLLNFNDVLVTRTGANFGQAAPYKSTEEIYACADLLVVKCNKILGGYLSTFLNTKYGRLMLDRGVYGAAQPHISSLYLKQLKVPRFSNTFETSIDNLLNKSNTLNSKTINLYNQSEELLLKELGLLNWQPEHKLYSVKKYSEVEQTNRFDAEYFQPKYDEIINTITQYSNGFDKISNIVDIKKNIEVGSEEYVEKGIPFVRVSNLTKMEINDNNLQYITEKLYDNLAKVYQPQKGEILLSKDGTAGIAFYIDEQPKNMILSGGILRLKIKNKEYLPEYLTLVLNSLIVQQQVERVSSGALIKHWLIDEVNTTLIPKLGINKQKEIVAKIQESSNCRKQSKQLLEIAKREVEIAIEENEETATDWINNELLKTGVEL